ncbi:MAG: hypothetical protein ACOYMG_16215 [Candidatus Methylumidiphilus sp.]
MSKRWQQNFLHKPSLLTVSLMCLGLADPVLAADTHCTNQETIEFNCSTGKKILSVCASKDLSTAKGYMQYRFGAKDTPEIQVPAVQNHPNPLVQSGTLSFSGGGGAYLRFLKGDFRYVVYTATGKDWGKKAGVAVEEGDKLLANIKCKGPAQSTIGPKLFEQAGLPASDKAFQLP